MNDRERATEKALLGCAIRANRVIDDIRQIVVTDDFCTDAHQRIWKAMLSLHDAGKAVSLPTLADELKRSGQISDVTYPYLGELVDDAPIAASDPALRDLLPGEAKQLAEIVHDHGLNRRYQFELRQLLDDAEKHRAPTHDLIGQGEKVLQDLGDTRQRSPVVPLWKAVNLAANYIDDAQLRRDRIIGIPTGFIELDRELGGLQGAELIVIGARPSKGKTSLGLCIVRNVAVESRLPVFFASLEQRTLELALRLLSAEASVAMHRIRRGMIDERGFETLPPAMEKLRQARVFIDDTPGQTMTEIAVTARRLKRQEGIRLTIIDYIALIESEERRRSRYEHVTEVSGALKRLARQLEMPVLALAQLNRNPENRGDERPRLSDLRDTGAIEQDADTVLLLHEPKDNPGTVEVIIAKQRNGPIGQVTLRFEKEFTRFSDATIVDPFEKGADGK